jgi:hypothetical protein
MLLGELLLKSADWVNSAEQPRGGKNATFYVYVSQLETSALSTSMFSTRTSTRTPGVSLVVSHRSPRLDPTARP